MSALKLVLEPAGIAARLMLDAVLNRIGPEAVLPRGISRSLLPLPVWDAT